MTCFKCNNELRVKFDRYEYITKLKVKYKTEIFKCENCKEEYVGSIFICV